MTPKKVELARNVKSLMDEKYAASKNRPMALSKEAHISLSSVQRALSGETAPNLDTLEALAGVFQITIGELVGEGRPQGFDIDQQSLATLKRLSKDALAAADLYQALPDVERFAIRKKMLHDAIPYIKDSERLESAVICMFKQSDGEL